MINLNSYTKNRVIAPILIGVSILFGVLAVKPLYTSSIETRSALATVNASIEQKTSDKEKLIQIKNMSSSGMSDAIKAKVTQLDRKFVPSDLMQEVMLNKFTEKQDSGVPTIIVSNISVDKWGKVPSGLSLGHVNISIRRTSLDAVIDYLTYLTTESGFAFTLDNITLPIDTDPETTLAPTSYGMSLSLWVYYFE